MRNPLVGEASQPASDFGLGKAGVPRARAPVGPGGAGANELLLDGTLSRRFAATPALANRRCRTARSVAIGGLIAAALLAAQQLQLIAVGMSRGNLVAPLMGFA